MLPGQCLNESRGEVFDRLAGFVARGVLDLAVVRSSYAMCIKWCAMHWLKVIRMDQTPHHGHRVNEETEHLSSTKLELPFKPLGLCVTMDEWFSELLSSGGKRPADMEWAIPKKVTKCLAKAHL